MGLLFHVGEPILHVPSLNVVQYALWSWCYDLGQVIAVVATWDKGRAHFHRHIVMLLSVIIALLLVIAGVVHGDANMKVDKSKAS